jgi:hypothetical protein
VSSKPEFLKKVFSEEFEITYRNRRTVFKCMREHRNVLFCVLARPKHERKTKGPESDFEPYNLENWDIANVIVDTSDHPDGQKLAFELGTTFRSTYAALRKIFGHINAQNSFEGWDISVNPIVEFSEFWSKMEENQGLITEIRFELIPPNIFGGDSEIEEALKELEKEDKAEEVHISIRNHDGELDPKSERIKSAVSYTLRGGGTLEARANRQTIFSSEASVKTVSIDGMPRFRDVGSEALNDAIERLGF